MNMSCNVFKHKSFHKFFHNLLFMSLQRKLNQELKVNSILEVTQHSLKTKFSPSKMQVGVEQRLVYALSTLIKEDLLATGKNTNLFLLWELGGLSYAMLIWGGGHIESLPPLLPIRWFYLIDQESNIFSLFLAMIHFRVLIYITYPTTHPSTIVFAEMYLPVSGAALNMQNKIACMCYHHSFLAMKCHYLQHLVSY